MFCSNCGKNIPDQAKFCNYCGSPVNNVQYQAQPTYQAQPSYQPQPNYQAQPSYQPQPVQQAQPKKKGKGGALLLRLVIVLAVYFAVRAVAGTVISNQQKKESRPSSSQSIVTQQTTAPTQAAPAEDPMDACDYGALYENGFLRYGMTRLNMPGFTLLPGEGSERDWLSYSNGTYLFAAYKQMEIPSISFSASTEEILLNSYKATYSDARMISFEKYYVDGYPVICYTVAYTVEGVSQYLGEAIVFPSETTNATIRLAVLVDAAVGRLDMIDLILETLEVSPTLTVKKEETGVMGLNRITVK